MVWGIILSLIAGIDRRFSIFPFLLLFSILPVFRRERKAGVVVLYLFLLACFFLFGLQATAAYYTQAKIFSSFAEKAGKSGRKTLSGWVASYPSKLRSKSRFTLRTTIGGQVVDVQVACYCPALAYGERVLLQGWAKAAAAVSGGNEFAIKKLLRSRGLVGFINAKKGQVQKIEGQSGSLIVRSFFWPMHNTLRNEITRSMGIKGGIPLALLLGEKGMLESKTRRCLSRLGISHLFALSGLHLGLVLGVTVLIMRLLGSRNKIILMASLTMYVGIVGDVPSLHRAYTMALLAAVAVIAHRPLNPVGILGNALLILLLLKPCSLYSAGFQFSFVATYAVLICVSRMAVPKHQSLWSKLRISITSSIRISVYAQAFIFPLALYYFGEASLVTPLATVIFLPLVFALLILTAVSAVAGLMSSGAGAICFMILGKCNGLFFAFLMLVCRISPEPMRLNPPCMVLYYAGMGVFLGLKARSGMRILGILLVIGAFLLPDSVTQLINRL